MELLDVIKLISQKTGKNINQSLLAKSLGITRQTVSNRIKNSSYITVHELQKIEEFFGISLLNSTNTFSNLINLRFYNNEIFFKNNLLCGEHEYIQIPQNLIKNYNSDKNYIMLRASGDAMLPTISCNDLLILELGNNAQIFDNKIYVIRFSDELFIRRLSKNIDEIIIKSDNEEYATKSIKDSFNNDFCIIGNVVNIIKQV